MQGHAWGSALVAAVVALGCGDAEDLDAPPVPMEAGPDDDGGFGGADSADPDPEPPPSADTSAIPQHCPTTVATGTEVGQVPPDFALSDAEGATHRLWDHCGQTILLVAGAQW